MMASPRQLARADRLLNALRIHGDLALEPGQHCSKIKYGELNHYDHQAHPHVCMTVITQKWKCW